MRYDPRVSEIGRLKIGELAERTGKSVAQLRKWQERYGIVEPERSAGNQRLYCEEDVRAVKAMCALIDSGLAPAEAARIVLADRRRERAMPDISALDLASESARMRRSLMRLDRDGAAASVERMLASFSFEEVAEEVLLPYLLDVGERWNAGEGTIAEEHLASQLLRGYLLGLPAGPQLPGRPRALLACPPGEQHDLALVIHAVALAQQGWQVTLLGADTPVSTIALAAEKLVPDCIVVAATMPGVLERALTELATLGQVHRVVVAGPAADAALARRAGITFVDANPIRAVDLLLAGRL